MARIFANFININKGREGRESLPQKKTVSHQNQSVVIKPTKKMSKTMTKEKILQVFPLLLTRVNYLENAGQVGKARTKLATFDTRGY